MQDDERWERYERYPYLLAKMCTFGVVVVAVGYVLAALEGVLLPVIAALAFAYLLDPLVDVFETRGWTRSAAIGWLLVAAMAAVAGFAFVLLPTIVNVLHRFVAGAPQLLDELDALLLPYVGPWLSDPPPVSLSEMTGEFGEKLSEFVPQLASQLGSWGTTALEGASSFTSSLFNLVLMPFFAFYFLRDFDIMKAAAIDLVPLPYRERVVDGAVRVDGVVGAWFRGQLEVAGILGGMYAVGLGACFGQTEMGVLAGVAVGVLAGVLNFIPYVGTSIGVVLAFGLLILDGASVYVLCGAVATFGVVQTLEGYVITPQIVGDKVGLSTLAVILALSIGGQLFGLLGMLLALPGAGVCMAFWPDIRKIYTKSEFFLGTSQGEAEE